MKTIYVLCALGMSSSFFTNRLKKIFEKKKIDVEIHARDEAEIDDFVANADLILLAPQAAYALEELKKSCDSCNKKLVLLPGDIYGTLDEEKLADFIFSNIDL